MMNRGDFLRSACAAAVAYCLPATSASEADERAFAARPEVLLESPGNGFR